MIDEDTKGPIYRAWAVAHGAAPEEFRWSARLVKDRLEEAVMVASRTQGKVGPRMPGQSIPDTGWDPVDKAAFEFLMLNDLTVARRYAAERNRSAFTASLAMLTRAEDAIRWQWRYLENAPKETADALQLKLRSRNFAEACRVLGLNRNTANKRVDKALLTIATGLILDRIPTGIDPRAYDRRARLPSEVRT